MNNKALERMKELVAILSEAAKAYYAEDREIMSNLEYDRLYDELVSLEEESGIVLAKSPTVTVGYTAVDELPKERHASPMLSLGKTKSREELADWLLGKEGVLSWKLDGLTVVLTYENGSLQKAVTRGNGEIGEVITENAKMFTNIPLKIAHQGRLVLRGEAVISYPDFEAINKEIPETEEKYKNPRNLCSGSVRQLNNEVTGKRRVRFIAFSLVEAENVNVHNSRMTQFTFLQEQGFEVVEHYAVTPDTILDKIAFFEEKIQDYEIPSDGLVLSFEDIAYGESLGRTAKFPRHSIAFKWADAVEETTLLEVEWSPSRTGLINPVAIFAPVELEGTTVSRASLHNVSVLRALKLGIGDRITVFKANMIIPQLAENLTKSDTLVIPCTCPACGGRTEQRSMLEAVSLYCINEKCPAKAIGQFTQFVSRNAMNIDGLSESTLEKFIAKGFIHSFADIYRLNRYKAEMIEMEGFGEKSYENLEAAISASRKTTLARVLFGLGITGVGAANGKVLAKAFHGDAMALLSADEEALSSIDGIGEVIAKAITDYFADEDKRKAYMDLLKELSIAQESTSNGAETLSGMTFVITGSLVHYDNRDALKAEIESLGGKVAGAVTGKTVCLINNDVASQSSKNKKAKSLGVPILSEDEFLKTYLEKG